MMNIVLLEPEIPMNTGNIGRTCVAAGARLHLIEPLGFRLDEKMIKRSGLDYWDALDLHVYDSYRDFMEKNPGLDIYLGSTKAPNDYSQVHYSPDSYIMFGKESAGIPEEILAQHPDRAIRIPMMPTIRSLNLSNSVAIVLYEALRQNNFPGMQMKGSLTNYDWK
ncbi:tRNA (cytidine(34)-2'-O)-methyltransferase [Parasporobacterium paucivorans]|uniref:Putative tRNA (cytidine(34)-2'-O)-methyltransferase n=1 Tax=Parasporobacterium paucivorans DSM 15970 TaxID=1122934 RepID=A0A1M6CVC7_9FIRM|nr:tRNA (cytidine(34)-2'-O)-methyltransferase [Parasporobacterium paucivorans]SHI64909.1 tRNA (cytidine/uridine-2'-O-)-methyltransferase [Parasporobacterium paucivorans DSM 15970]